MAADLRVLVAMLVHRERTGAHGRPRRRHRPHQPDARRGAAAAARSATSARWRDLAGDMLRRSLTAFVDRDAETARLICDEDDEHRHAVRPLVPRADPGDRCGRRRTSQRITYLIWTCAQPRTHRRPRDEHLRAGDLHGHRTAGGDQRFALLARAAAGDAPSMTRSQSPTHDSGARRRSWSSRTRRASRRRCRTTSARTASTSCRRPTAYEGLQAARREQPDVDRARPDAAEDGRARGLPPAARRVRRAHPDAHGEGRGAGQASSGWRWAPTTT